VNATLGLLVSAVLLAGAAEPPTTPAAAPAAVPQPTAEARSAPQASAAPAARGVPPKTVEGLTVIAPLPNKPCSSRDRECIALVVAELKQLYPEQLKRFCFQRTMRAMRSQMLNDQLLEGLSSDNPPPSTSFGVNSALSVACKWDKK
jgi:hypothetical protein